LRNRKIKFVRGENIICFKKIEINFEKLGSVIVVRGKNFDDQEIGVNSNFNSNGSGKSSLADVISYALYGKTLKKPKKIAHGDVIHNDADYLKVEIAIDNYLITRTRKRTKSSDKGTLDVWRDGSKLSMSKPILEKLVIEEVIGLTYEVFSNVFLFGDDISSSFLECDLTDKRNIVENLLSLDRFRDYHENAKNNLKNIKDTIKEASRSVEVASSDLSKIEFRYKDLKSKSFLWTEKQSREISDLKKEIQNIKSIDTSNELIKYSESKLLLSKIENDYKSLSLKREQATTYQSAAETKFSVAQKMCADYNNKLTKISSEIKSLEINLNLINKFLNSLPDGCPTCGQDLPDPDRDRLNVEKINEKNICENKLKELIVEKNKLSEELKVFNESKKTLSDVIFECRKKIGVFDSEMFKLRSEITKLSSVKPPKESEVILETIKGLENRITDKLSEINPYISLLKNVELEEIDKKNELEIKNKELDNAKEDLPYREFIVKLFGDDGVPEPPQR
jgi:DNA repair exonuclease SbcCD ATPase subunit